jgi:hypothetical protein
VIPSVPVPIAIPVPIAVPIPVPVAVPVAIPVPVAVPVPVVSVSGVRRSSSAAEIGSDLCCDIAVGGVQATCNAAHACRDTHGNHRREQGVLNQILSGLIQEGSGHTPFVSSKARNEMGHSHRVYLKSNGMQFTGLRVSPATALEIVVCVNNLFN